MNVTSASPSFMTMTGSESGAPDNSLPVALDVSKEEVLRGLNPLQHVPIVGMIYRAATGEQIPTTMRVAGAGLVGGPLGMVGAGFMSLVEALIKMGPDTSRPAVPVGMAQTGSESGMDSVAPGTGSPGSYVTLATSTPDFLQSTPNVLLAQNGAAAYQSADLEWRRSQSLEKGLV